MKSARESTRRGWRRLTMMGALAGALVGLTACDNLLEVELPDAVTDAALDNPRTAPTLVNSVMASVECAYSTFALRAAGREDNFQRYSGAAGSYSEYTDTPPGGICDVDPYNNDWVDQMLLARGQGYDVYEQLGEWTVEQVPNRTQLQAETALYNAVAVDVFGEHFCEFAIDEGPLLTPDATLDVAEEWVDTALGHIAETGDFAIEKDQGVITTSAETMAHGLKARILWAKGELDAAAAEAALVPDGFYAYVLRESGEKRRNMVSSMQGGGGGVQAAGFLQGPVRLKTDDVSYGISQLGTNPVTGEDWPNPVPFTGYLDLAIETATGRAVTSAGYPITEDELGTVEDPRVPHTIGNTAGGPDNIIQKYTSLADDIPLVSWVEMRLIRAEANPAEAVEHVNAVRNGSVYIGGSTMDIDLPEVTYGPSTDEEIRRMIVEERRRGLWLEGRFWSTKIQNTDLLWFPRFVGEWVNTAANYQLGGGVRVLMPEDEYELNDNLSLADRGTGCADLPGSQAPVFN